MTVRKAVKTDLPDIMAIYRGAQTYMVKTGNPTQWPVGHPPEAMIRQDMAAGACFVLEEAGKLEGVFALYEGEDPTYRVIQGAWLTDGPYVTVHRLASAGRKSRVADECFSFCEQFARGKCVSIRVDTHEQNTPMRRAIGRCGFTYCGQITVKDGTPRRAYEKIIPYLQHPGFVDDQFEIEP